MFRRLRKRLAHWWQRMIFRSDLRSLCCPHCEIEIEGDCE